MKHFILSFRHLMLLAIMFFSITASAYDFEVDGMYYNIVSATDLTCKVTSGDNKYTGDMVIPRTITYKNRTLTITEIGNGAFSGCSSLTSVKIPNSVEFLDYHAFAGCSGLKSLVIEESKNTLRLSCNLSKTSSLGQGLFYDCTVETLYIGRNLSYDTSGGCGISPFAYNKNITNVTIGSSVTSIGNKAFLGCSGLKSLVFEDGEDTLELGYNLYKSKDLGQGLFYDCPVETLYIGRNLSYDSGKYYGYSPFAYNKNITNVTIGNSVTTIGSFAFDGCHGLTNVTIGNSVAEIGWFAFEGCRRLTNVTIGNSVAEIGRSAFNYCSSLTSITIPNSVTKIGDDAFYNCSSLTSVTIGNSVTEIGSYAFYRCSSLTSVISLNPTPPSFSSSNSNYFDDKQYMDATLYVPQDAISAYKSANTWKNFWNIQGIDVTGIQKIETTKQTPTAIYDLQGRKLSKPKKGINIINGKKVLVK